MMKMRFTFRCCVMKMQFSLDFIFRQNEEQQSETFAIKNKRSEEISREECVINSESFEVLPRKIK